MIKTLASSPVLLLLLLCIGLVLRESATIRALGQTAPGLAIEREGLRSIYTSFDGPSWSRRDSWNNNLTSYCNWFGLSCDTSGRLTKINLNRNRLRGDGALLNLSAFQYLTTADFDGNQMYGEAPIITILSLSPTLTTADLHDNDFTSLPLTLPPSIASANYAFTVSLVGNRFWCPLPAYVNTMAVFSDITNASCLRTLTHTMVYSQTLRAEVPVPTSDLFDPNQLVAQIYFRSSIDVNQSSNLDIIQSTLATILLGDGGSSSTLSTLFDLSVVTWREVLWVEVDFSSFLTQTTNAQRVDLALRMRSGHTSILALQIFDVYWLYDGETLPTEAPPMTQVPLVGYADRTQNRNWMIWGAVVFSILVVIVLVSLCCVRSPTYLKGSAQFVKQNPGPNNNFMMTAPNSQQNQMGMSGGGFGGGGGHEMQQHQQAPGGMPGPVEDGTHVASVDGERKKHHHKGRRDSRQSTGGGGGGSEMPPPVVVTTMPPPMEGSSSEQQQQQQQAPQMTTATGGSDIPPPPMAY